MQPARTSCKRVNDYLGRQYAKFEALHRRSPFAASWLAAWLIVIPFGVAIGLGRWEAFPMVAVFLWPAVAVLWCGTEFEFEDLDQANRVEGLDDDQAGK